MIFKERSILILPDKEDCVRYLIINPHSESKHAGDQRTKDFIKNERKQRHILTENNITLRFKKFGFNYL